MNSQTTELLPCPFCGAGETFIKENGRVWLGSRWGEPSSVSVQHWCEPINGQPSRMLERVGRDHDSAVAAWNRRAALEHAPFDEVWRRDYEWDGKRGYRYGHDALEQVRFGYEIACKALAATPSAGEAEARDAERVRAARWLRYRAWLQGSAG